jgi:hypothetical protein
VTIVIGVVSAVLGLAYLALGVIAAFEVVESHKTYGVSRFGLGYILMATSCGPHHLLHASHVFQGQDISGSVAIATLIGLPSGVIFVGLRVEAMLGGRGDRFVSGTPNWLIGLPLAALVLLGALIAWSIQDGFGWDRAFTVTFAANAFVTVTYALVGWPLLRTQVRRRPERGGWSVAGLSLATIFPTCAIAHLVYAMSATGDTHTRIVDLWGIPASVYFLWVVRALYREAIVDWNARPVVGHRRLTPRHAPWETPIGLTGAGTRRRRRSIGPVVH